MVLVNEPHIHRPDIKDWQYDQKLIFLFISLSIYWNKRIIVLAILKETAHSKIDLRSSLDQCWWSIELHVVQWISKLLLNSACYDCKVGYIKFLLA